MKQLLITIAAVVLAGCGESPKNIWEAAETGNIEAVKQYLAAGTSVNSKQNDRIGNTPLNFATMSGHKKIVELLIASGADVNVKNNYGIPPLNFAIRDKQTEIADLLRKHGGKTGASANTVPTHRDQLPLFRN